MIAWVMVMGKYRCVDCPQMVLSTDMEDRIFSTDSEDEPWCCPWCGNNVIVEMNDDSNDSEMYKETAQICIELYSHIEHEFGSRRGDVLDSAQKLYEEHGPFELDWSMYPFEGDSPEWYNE